MWSKNYSPYSLWPLLWTSDTMTSCKTPATKCRTTFRSLKTSELLHEICSSNPLDLFRVCVDFLDPNPLERSQKSSNFAAHTSHKLWDLSSPKYCQVSASPVKSPHPCATSGAGSKRQSIQGLEGFPRFRTVTELNPQQGIGPHTAWCDFASIRVTANRGVRVNNQRTTKRQQQQ